MLLPLRPCIFQLGVTDILVQRNEVTAWSCCKINPKLIVAALGLAVLVNADCLIIVRDA